MSILGSKEVNTDKEALAVQADLKKSINTLLTQRGVNPEVIAARELNFSIKLSSQDEDVLPLYGTSLVEVQNFVNAQYPGRQVGVRSIEIAYDSVALEVTSIHSDSSESEAEKDYKELIDRKNEIVLGNEVFLDLSRTPIEYRITTYPLKEWMRGSMTNPNFIKGKLDPKVISAIASLIPDENPNNVSDVFKKSITISD